MRLFLFGAWVRHTLKLDFRRLRERRRLKLEDPALVQLWRRLGRLEVWGWQFFVFALVLTSTLSLAFDAVRLNNYSILWIPINILALGIACLFVFLALLVLKMFVDPRASRPTFNLLVAGIAMGIKNVATLNIANIFGIYDQGDLSYRFIGGASIGIALIFIFNNLVGTQIERKAYLESLLAKERALVGFRENVNELYKEEEKELTERTRDSLMPRFLELQKQVEAIEDLNKFSQKLKTFLMSEIRPLSKSIAEEAANLSRSGQIYSEGQVSEPEIRIDLKKTILPISTWLLTCFAWFMTSPIVLPGYSFLEIFIASLVYLALLYVLKALLHKAKAVSLNKALVFSAVPGIIGALPSYFLISSIPHAATQSFLLPTFYITAGWSAISVSQYYLLSESKSVVVNRLQVVVEKFARENKLFEQRLWVARHVWYTLLHGTVQSAITAATIRASGSDGKSNQAKKLILADLNRAMDALKTSNPENIQLEDQIEELRNTWDGIVELDCEIPTDLAKDINSSRDSVIVFNELLKEIVSNSVRHGQASQVQVSLELVAPGEVNLIAINNGTKPKKSGVSSIGTTVFNSLCLKSQLSWNKETKRAEFTALVPIA